MSVITEDNGWPYAETLDEHAILTRVDFAKHATHNNIISSSSPGRIYIEDILNTFIAIVQHPINFVFFNEKRECLFHFCKDPFHKHMFGEILQEIREDSDDVMFDFFNHEVTDEKRFVSLVYMNTKNGGRPFPIRKTEVDFSINKHFTEKVYIAVCAQLYFSDEWNTLNSYAFEMFMSGIRDSIAELTKQHLGTRGGKRRKFIHKSEQYFPTKEFVSRLSRTLAITNASSSYVSKLALQRESNRGEKRMPETLLAFRDFGGADDYQRYNSLYNYRTRFIVSEEGSNTFHYRRILDDLRRQYPIDQNGDPESCIQEYSKCKNVPYSKITLVQEERERLTKELDMRFWQMLHDENLSSKDLLNEILAVPVSDNARSLVDPVYQTGLIHYNRIFENAGLDRIDDSSIEGILSRDRLYVRKEGSDIEKDLLRIVLLYYLISSVISRNEKEEIQAVDILCVMFPIKIKGICWAVAIQAYHSKQTQLDLNDEMGLCKHRHGEQHQWASRYLLSTSFRRRLFSLTHSTCWEFALQYLIRSVAKCCLAFIEFRSSASELEKRLNDDMLMISAYLPYGFPEFIICTKEYADKQGYSDDSRAFLNKHDGKLCLAWNARGNPFFTPTLHGFSVDSRLFRSSIELGIALSLDQFYENTTLN